MSKVGVTYNGKKGVIFKSDQKRAFRCPCCGAKQNKDGKLIVRPADNHFGVLEDERKVLVDQDNVRVETLL